MPTCASRADRVRELTGGGASKAAAAHREVETGHTRGKLVLIVDDDLAAAIEVEPAHAGISL
jgi:hypothetical protein